MARAADSIDAVNGPDFGNIQTPLETERLVSASTYNLQMIKLRKVCRQLFLNTFLSFQRKKKNGRKELPLKTMKTP